MKFPALVLAMLFLLCGCAAQPQASTALPDTTEPPVTLPRGIYDAGSRIEETSGGAVKAFPLAMRAAAAAPMGQDIVVFSDTENTVLTLYRGEELCPAATLALERRVSLSDSAVAVSERGIVFYDAVSRELVFLNADLAESSRSVLPETVCGSPVVDAQQQKVFYCTSDSLRCLDLQTGLERFIKEMRFPYQSADALHCDGAVIACEVRADGASDYLYISTETGQLLYEDTEKITLQTDGTSYFAARKDGIYTELLTGSSEHGPTLLTPLTYEPDVYPLVQLGAIVTVSEMSNALQLERYDLQSGKRTHCVILGGTEEVRGFFTFRDCIWFLRYEPSYGCDVLYCWEFAKSEIKDSRNYLSARHTAQQPDLAGLAACREFADELSWKYGVQILLWTDATSFQPWDYTLVPEYQVPVIQRNLKELERFLSMYPRGFLEKAAALTSSGRIQICLVRGILGKAESAVSEAVGLQYWDHNRNSYLCLQVQEEGLSRNACHEMSHIIDSRVLTLCRAYDDWNSLNPKGFQYQGAESVSLSESQQQWLSDQSRAFIDSYSMSYPKEDRARIMEYAMMDGAESYFESDTMQKKLRQICLGIREAFDLKKSAEVFRWEQYLKTPLTPK